MTGCGPRIPAEKILMRTVASLDTVLGMFLCTGQSWFLKPRTAA